MQFNAPVHQILRTLDNIELDVNMNEGLFIRIKALGYTLRAHAFPASDFASFEAGIFDWPASRAAMFVCLSPRLPPDLNVECALRLMASAFACWRHDKPQVPQTSMNYTRCAKSLKITYVGIHAENARMFRLPD